MAIPNLDPLTTDTPTYSTPYRNPFAPPEQINVTQAAPAPATSALQQALTPNLPNDLEARINANLSGTPSPTPAAPTTPVDTSAVIANLPQARSQFVAKYQRLGPSFTQLPENVRSSVMNLDLQRVNKGQAPLTDQETLGAIVTAVRHQNATPNPGDHSVLHTITHLPEATVTDAEQILKGVFHLPWTLAKEVRDLPDFAKIYRQQLAATGNPVSALASSPGVRLIPGSFIVGNIARGPEGLTTIGEHPLLAALDVLPYANAAAKATSVGAIAAAEGTSPIRAVLTRTALPEGELTAAGSQLAPAKLGIPMRYAANNTTIGKWMVDAWGKGSRRAATIANMGDHMLADITQGDVKLDNPTYRAARESYALAAGKAIDKYGIDKPRAVEIGRALQTDRNLLADTSKFTDADRAYAARIVKLQQAFQAHVLGENPLMEFGGEIYDPKTGTKLRSMQDKLGKAAVKVDEGMFQRVTDARQAIHEQIANSPTERGTAAERALADKLDSIHATMDDYFNNPSTTTTLADLEKATQGLLKARTRLGAPQMVGAKAAPAGDIRLDSLIRVRSEVRDAAKQEAVLNKALGKAPARWHPAIQDAANTQAQDLLVQSGINPSEAARVIAERDFAAYPDLFNRDVIRDIIRDIEPTWRTLKEAGQDPVFLHRAPLNAEQALKVPRTKDFIGELSQTKKRGIYNPLPYNEDPTVGLAHQGLEIVAKDITTRTLDELTRTFGVPGAVLRERYLPQARELARLDPSFDVAGHVTKLMQKEWQPFDPRQIINGNSALKAASDSDAMWMPKSTMRVMDRFYNQTPNAILMAMQPVTGIFRTAVLPLSPRWHVNNIIGNTFVANAEYGPGVFRYWNEARKVLKEVKAGNPSILPDELRYSTNVARQEYAQSAYEAAMGHQLGNAWTKIQESKPASAIKGAVQKSYDINSFFDDTSRIMGYLHEYNKGIKSGLTDNAAKDVALESIHRVFQDWNAMTPIERSVLRQVFPFYAFTSYAVRFVTSYPALHPLRAAILANLAKATVDDLQADGQTPSMLDYLAIGKRDAQGNQDFINLRGMNPFADTASIFTLKGFLSGANPVLQAAGAAVGADINGTGNYQEQTYDPETGKIVAKHPGFGSSLLDSTVPQLGFLRRVSGADADFNALKRDNAEAADRLLVSGLGVPTLKRNINTTLESMKSEVKRQTQERADLKQALSTGDWSIAARWPNLRPLLAQLQILRDQGALTPYNPTAGAPGGLGSIPSAVRSVTPWPT